MTKPRFKYMPGVMAWLRLLRDEGAQRRERSHHNSANSARDHGFTDYLVRRTDTGTEGALQDIREQLGPGYYTLIVYAEGREVITEAGLKALEEYEQSA